MSPDFPNSAIQNGLHLLSDARKAPSISAQGTGTGKPESRSPELKQPSGMSSTASSAKNVIAAIRIFTSAVTSVSVLMGHHPVV